MVLVVLVVLERELQVVNGGSRATSGRRIRPGAARMKTVGAQQAAELSAELGEVQRQHGLVGWARRRGKWVDGDEDGEGQALCAWLRVAVGRCVVCVARGDRAAPAGGGSPGRPVWPVWAVWPGVGGRKRQQGRGGAEQLPWGWWAGVDVELGQGLGLGRGPCAALLG